MPDLRARLAASSNGPSSDGLVSGTLQKTSPVIGSIISFVAATSCHYRAEGGVWGAEGERGGWWVGRGRMDMMSALSLCAKVFLRVAYGGMFKHISTEEGDDLQRHLPNSVLLLGRLDPSCKDRMWPN